MDNRSFVFYGSTYDEIIKLPDTLRAKMFEAVCTFGITGEVKDLGDPMSNFALNMCINEISRAQERYERAVENGKRGGAPKGNANASKQPKTTKNNLKVNLSDDCINGQIDEENNQKQPKTTKNNLKVNLYDDCINGQIDEEKQPKTTKKQPKNNLKQPKTTKNNLDVDIDVDDDKDVDEDNDEDNDEDKDNDVDVNVDIGDDVDNDIEKEEDFFKQDDINNIINNGDDDMNNLDNLIFDVFNTNDDSPVKDSPVNTDTVNTTPVNTPVKKINEWDVRINKDDTKIPDNDDNPVLMYIVNDMGKEFDFEDETTKLCLIGWYNLVGKDINMDVSDFYLACYDIWQHCKIKYKDRDGNITDSYNYGKINGYILYCVQYNKPIEFEERTFNNVHGYYPDWGNYETF